MTKRAKTTECPRCEGSGVYAGFGVCYRCNGGGKVAPAPKRVEREAIVETPTERRARMVPLMGEADYNTIFGAE